MKYGRFIELMLCISIAAVSQAQLGIPKKAYWHCSGTFGNGLKLNINMVKINDSVYADCSFYSAASALAIGTLESGKPYNFCGRTDSKGNFQLHPFGNEYPLIKGQLPGTGISRGEIEESSNKKACKFEMSETYPAGSVQFNLYAVKHTVKLVNKPKSPFGMISMALLSPMESGNPLVSDSLRQIIFNAYSNSGYKGLVPDSVLAGNIRLFKKDYVSGNEDLYRQMPDAGSMDWELLRFMHVVCNRNYILSFYTLSYAFTGGAHGLETLDYRNVDLRKGSVIKLADILADGKTDELSRLLTRKLKLMNKIPETQKLTENGYFVDEIHPNENFYLTPYGLGFLYNHYDIAPYSFGATDIFLTADEVRDIIRPFMSGF